MNVYPFAKSLLSLGALLLALLPTHPAEFHVATNGLPSGNGSIEAPWDLTSALSGKHSIAAGDTLWVHGGVYKFPPKVGGQGFPCTLKGRDGAPIHIRAAKGERASLDGGLVINQPASYLWVWDLELLVSEPIPPNPVPPDSTYRNVNRPWGGLNINSGIGCKFINLVVHDNSQGVSWWSSSENSELHGCIIYDNGWRGTDRGHGHAIYTQNNQGTKRISDCIMTGGYGYTMHAYGSSRAFVDNYIVERNICYDGGRFLIGGGRPSHNIHVYSNYLYNVGMQLGYSATTNEDCVLRGNVIVNGEMQVLRFRQTKAEHNLVLQRNAPRPSGVRVLLHPNKYDPTRANLAIFNWDKTSPVTVDVSTFLRPGQDYELKDPRNFFGPAILSGKCSGKSVEVPMRTEFGVWVMKK